MIKMTIIASMAFLCLNTAQAVSFPEWSSNFLPPTSFSSDVANYNFEGIVALSNCSGSIVRYDDSVNTDRAMILTNGHCVSSSMLQPGEVIVNQPSSKTFTVLNRGAGKLGTVTADKLVYATMTKTDMGIYQLKETYADILAKYSINALTIARTGPADNTNIEVISGYWKRGYSCSVETTVNQLKEGNWMFENSVRYSRPGCVVIGGTSGSPVVMTDTRTVVAVNNTVSESGLRCAVNNPCEIDAQGNVTYEKGMAYAQQIYWLYSCRAATGEFNINTSTCALPKPQN